MRYVQVSHDEDKLPTLYHVSSSLTNKIMKSKFKLSIVNGIWWVISQSWTIYVDHIQKPFRPVGFLLFKISHRSLPEPHPFVNDCKINTTYINNMLRYYTSSVVISILCICYFIFSNVNIIPYRRWGQSFVVCVQICSCNPIFSLYRRYIIVTVVCNA